MRKKSVSEGSELHLDDILEKVNLGDRKPDRCQGLGWRGAGHRRQREVGVLECYAS